MLTQLIFPEIGLWEDVEATGFTTGVVPTGSTTVAPAAAIQAFQPSAALVPVLLPQFAQLGGLTATQASAQGQESGLTPPPSGPGGILWLFGPT
jgi:hypothetical protein